MGRPRPRANLETQAFRHSTLPTFGRKRNSGSFQPGGPVRGAGCRKMRRQVIGSSAAVLALVHNGRFASTDAVLPLSSDAHRATRWGFGWPPGSSGAYSELLEPK